MSDLTTTAKGWTWKTIPPFVASGNRCRLMSKRPDLGSGIWEGSLVRINDETVGVSNLTGDWGETRTTAVLSLSDIERFQHAQYGLAGDQSCPPSEAFRNAFEQLSDTSLYLQLGTLIAHNFDDLREVVKDQRFFGRHPPCELSVLPKPLQAIFRTTASKMCFITLIDRRSKLLPCLTLIIAVRQHLHENIRDFEVTTETRFVPVFERYAREDNCDDVIRSLPQRTLLGRLRAASKALFPSSLRTSGGRAASVLAGVSASVPTSVFDPPLPPYLYVTCERQSDGAIRFCQPL